METHKKHDDDVDEQHYLFAFIKHSPPLLSLPSSSSSSSSSHFHNTWEAKLSLLFLKFLIFLRIPVSALGFLLEFSLNLITGTITKIFFDPDASILPHPEHYRSFIGYLDSRYELHNMADHDRSNNTEDTPHLDSNSNLEAARVCVMASKLAYENPELIKRIVVQHWKMHFVKFFDCWNGKVCLYLCTREHPTLSATADLYFLRHVPEYLKYNTTQAFLFMDKESDANAVVLAFRGTSPFDVYDWCTDFDFSWYALREMGRVHVGFLEALGLGSRMEKETFEQVKINARQKAEGKTPPSTPTSGLPQSLLQDSRKVFAYDAICARVRRLLRANLGAKFYVTGHSLGGALSALFCALLLLENDYLILHRLQGIFTFGQPRVGDEGFARFMESHFCQPDCKYFRVVYGVDVVPRIPFDNGIFNFKHFGRCHYYHTAYQAKILCEEPHKNYVTLMFWPSTYMIAALELIQSMVMRYSMGEDYGETWFSLLLRMPGIVMPGICAHGIANYVNGVRLGGASSWEMYNKRQLVNETSDEVIGGWNAFCEGSRQLYLLLSQLRLDRRKRMRKIPSRA